MDPGPIWAHFGPGPIWAIMGRGPCRQFWARAHMAVVILGKFFSRLVSICLQHFANLMLSRWTRALSTYLLGINHSTPPSKLFKKKIYKHGWGGSAPPHTPRDQTAATVASRARAHGPKIKKHSEARKNIKNTWKNTNVKNCTKSYEMVPGPSRTSPNPKKP